MKGMKVLLVSNDKATAGPVRARLFAQQYDQIVMGLRNLGFQGEIPCRELDPTDPIVSGDYQFRLACLCDRERQCKNPRQ